MPLAQSGRYSARGFSRTTTAQVAAPAGRSATSRRALLVLLLSSLAAALVPAMHLGGV